MNYLIYRFMRNFNSERTSSFGTNANQRMNEGLRNYMVYVYQNMSAALGLSGLVAYLFSQSPAIMQLIHGSPLGMIIAIAPIGLAFFFGFKIVNTALQFQFK